MASAESKLSVPAVVLFLAAAVMLSQTAAQSLVPLTKAEKQAILDAHNGYRARTARGETTGQPSAGDMMLLEWDDRLMNKAAEWAAQCTTGHDTTEQRLIPGYSWVGQNFAGGDTQNMSLFVQLWFDEYKDFTFSSSSSGTCIPGKVCGHYTQVVWSRSLLVGCASARCPGNPRTLVCNYAQGGNLGDLPPYASAPPASQCIGEFVLTEGSVCLIRDQCQAGSACRCAIQCLNGGTLDSGACRCACTPDFYGTRCELACEDPELWRESCQSDADACTNFPTFCPKTCRLCTTSDIRDKDAVNAAGVVARVPSSSRRK